MTTEHPHVQKSLFYSIVDGIFFTIMVGCGERFFIPFALLLGASYFEIGLLVSLPILLGSLFQILGNYLIERTSSRKKVILRGLKLQSFIFIPLIFLCVFFSQKLIFLFIALVIVYWIGGHIASPAWNSWMGDLVSFESRGSYFGKRNKTMEISNLLTFICAGIFLHFMKIQSYEVYGFLVLFIIAFVARSISVHYLSKKYEPSFTVKEDAKFTFFAFVKKLKTTNFGSFVLFSAFMNFSFYIASPFYAPYMLKELEFSYFQYMIVAASAMASRLVFLPIWGQYIDQYGTKKTLSLSASLLPITVGLWLVSGNFYFIILIHIFSGLAWSGFELSSFTFILNSTSSEKRARCVAYYNALTGFFILSGSIIGSQLVKIQLFSWPLVFSAFFVSSLLRGLFTLILLPRIKEVKTVDSITYKKLFTHVLFQPFASLAHK